MLEVDDRLESPVRRLDSKTAAMPARYQLGLKIKPILLRVQWSPEQIADKLHIQASKQVGYWECDTVDINHKGAAETMDDRKSGYGVMGKLTTNKTSELVR